MNIRILMDGGNIQEIIASEPVTVEVVDFDIEGAEVDLLWRTTAGIPCYMFPPVVTNRADLATNTDEPFMKDVNRLVTGHMSEYTAAEKELLLADELTCYHIGCTYVPYLYYGQGSQPRQELSQYIAGRVATLRGEHSDNDT